MDPLVQKVASNIRGHCLLKRGDSVVVGVSGGLDSVVLLDILCALSEEWRWRLVIAHVNHGLRGRKADADERFVGLLAVRHSLPFRRIKVDVRGAARGSESIEMAARRIRHAFLARVQRQRSASAIALAHQADDQVELFFLRLFRGSGARGLGGMLWCGPSPVSDCARIIRPLLDVTRPALESYASRRRLHWREDATNADLSIPRNRIRRELLPLLERKYCPAIRQVVPRCMDILRVDADFVAQTAEKLGSGARPFPSEVHEAVRRALVRRMLLREGKSATFADVSRQASPTALTPSDGPRPERGFKRARHLVKLVGRSGQFEADNARIQWSFRRRARPFGRRNPGEEQLDSDRVGSSVTLRFWRAGDRFQPLGFERPSKLQDLFVNRKIPAEERRTRLLATDAEGTIFWVEGLPPGEAFKVKPETRRVLVWKSVRLTRSVPPAPRPRF